MPAHTILPNRSADGACSICGGMLSLGVCIGGSAANGDSRLWWIDAVVAVSISAGLFLYGLFTLWKNSKQGNVWWRSSFWLTTPASRRARAVQPFGEHVPPLEEALNDGPAELRGPQV